MAVVRIWRSDLPGSTATAEAEGDDPPPGWIVVDWNEGTGTSRTVLASREELVTWTGAVAPPRRMTPDEMRKALAEIKEQREKERAEREAAKAAREAEQAAKAAAKAEQQTQASATSSP